MIFFIIDIFLDLFILDSNAILISPSDFQEL